MNEQDHLKTLTEMQNEGVDLFDEAFPLSRRRQMAESLSFAISAIERSRETLESKMNHYATLLEPHSDPYVKEVAVMMRKEQL